MTTLEQQLYDALKAVSPWAAKAVGDLNSVIGRRALVKAQKALDAAEYAQQS